MEPALIALSLIPPRSSAWNGGGIDSWCILKQIQSKSLTLCRTSRVQVSLLIFSTFASLCREAAALLSYFGTVQALLNEKTTNQNKQRPTNQQKPKTKTRKNPILIMKAIKAYYQFKNKFSV